MPRTEYLYGNLSGIPSEAHLFRYVADSVIPNDEFEVSRNDTETWMKIWMDPELSAENKVILDTCVVNCLDKNKYTIESRSEYYELVLQLKKWRRHRRRVTFNNVFVMIPTLSISNPVFDGAADLTIVAVTKKYFDFVVVARGKRSTDGLTMVSFDWEAIA